MTRDSAGNVVLKSTVRTRKTPVYLTAHIDHPGFVVTSVDRSRRVGVEFRVGFTLPTSTMPGWISSTATIGCIVEL